MKKIFNLIRPVLIFLLTGSLLAIASDCLYGQTVAFPGALGFGANATGGRSGAVYHVTTLADSGPGSFRDAVSEENRIVVFDVGGYISLSSAVSVKSNITIAGQTAPGEGIGFKGGEISFANSTNIICRYIRIRPGSETSSTGDDCLSFYRATNIIVDHLSLEFAPWNNIDGVSDDWQNHPVTNITVQNSIIANPTGQQFGAHTEGVNGTWSWFYNIFANSHNRNPLAKINTVFINNVLYNYQAGYTTHTGTPFNHDIVNNYFILGPATTTDNTWFQVDKNQSIYYAGNMKDSLLDGILNGGITTPYWYQGPGTILTSPWSSWTTAVTPYSTQTAYRLTTSLSGTLPRDQLDSLVISQIETLGNGTTGTGIGTTGPDGGLYTSQDQTGLPNNGYGVINGGMSAHDMDGDGMPDYWEQATGSNPSSDDAMTSAGDGYVLIEHYLHWLAEPHIATRVDSEVVIDLHRYTGGFLPANPTYTVSNATNGNIVLQPDGHTVKFMPAQGFKGLGSFNFTVSASDGSNYSSKATIAVSSEPSIVFPSDVMLSAISKLTPSPKSIVTVKWKDHADNETHFILERAKKDLDYIEIAQPAANDTIYVDSLNVRPDSTYYYRIRAVNDTDTSYYSQPASVLTPSLPAKPDTATAPDPGDGVNAIYLTDNKITLSWNGSDNTNSYIVYFGSDPASLQKKAEVTDASYQASGLAAGNTYYWRITSVNEAGVTIGKIWSFVTTNTPPSSQDGLVGYWSLDETGTGTNATDSSVYHNNGVLGLDGNNPDIRIAGYKNNGLDLASLNANAYAVSIPDQSQLLLDKSSFTISIWMKADPSMFPTDNSTDYYLFCKGSIGTDPAIGSTGKRFDLEFKNKKLRFAIDDANDANGGGKDELQTDATPFFTGKWVNIIAIRDTADKKLRIYLDGVLVAEKSISKATSGIGEASALIIGNIGEKELLSGKTTTAPFKGMIDELKIFNYAMDQAGVASLSGIYPKGIVGYWSFDETGTGKEVQDSSMYKNDGLLGVNSSDAGIRVEGHRNKGVDFSTMGTSDYGASIPDQGQLFLDKSAFSISFWMKADPSLIPTDKNTSVYLLCKGSVGTDPAIGSTGKRFDLEVKQGTLRFALDAGDAGEGGKDEMKTDATPMFTGKWVNVIVIRDTVQQKMQVYINGSLVAEHDISKSKYGIGEHSALILGNIGEKELLSGSFTPAPYKGMLDEVKIFNYALTYPEIITLFYGSPLPQKAFAPSYNNITLDGYEDTLKLTWQGGVNTLKYQLYMGADSTHLTEVADSIDINKPVYELVNVPSQINYYWRIDATGILGTTQGDLWQFKTGFPKGLVAHYALDEASDTIAIDSSAYQHNGTLKDMPDAVRIKGKFGNALGFGSPGSTGAIVVPDAPQIRFDNSSFTISLWVKLPAYNTTSGKYNCYLVQKGTFENVSEGTGKWYGIQLKDKTLTFAIDDGINKTSAGVSVSPGSKFDIFNKGWVHIIALRSNEISRIRLYINGVFAKSVNDSKVTGTIGKESDLLIGNSAENKPFPDSLDDVRIYNYALSEALIDKLYHGVPLLKKVTDPSPDPDSVGAGPEKVNFSWKDPTGTALSYRFYFGASPDSLRLKASGIPGTAFELDSLIPSTVYYWRVEDSSDVEGVMGDLWSFTTGKDTIPPHTITKSISVDLDASGAISITPEDVDDQSNDVYGIDTFLLDRSEFNCSDVGENKVVLTTIDSYGNASSDTAVVTVNGVIPDKPVVSPSDTVICEGDWIKLFANEDEKAASYRWLYNGNEIEKTEERIYPTGDAGSYRVFAVSAQSCPSDTSMPAILSISEDTLLQVSENMQITRGAGVQLTANGSEGDITWSPDIDITITAGSSVRVAPRSTTKYTATLMNVLGCRVSRDVWVTVEDKFEAEYNKMLTPNGDGVNDKLVIKNLAGYPNNRIQIFDYSGKRIYEKNGYNNDWDGRINGRIAVRGTYYFVLMIDGKIKIKGSITIIH